MDVNELYPDVCDYAFGFEAKLSKDDILSLIKDDEVKVIYSMDFSYKDADFVPGCCNE